MQNRKPSDYKYILFDLDGTLTDSFPGICRCVKYALSCYGIQEESMDKMREFCGPPLMDSFQKIYNYTYEEAEDLVRKFRQEYTVKGIFENSVFEGIPEMLQELRDAGREILLATSKPENLAYIVLNHFDLARYFHTITGADLRDDIRHSKADVIVETMLRHGISEEEKSQVLMVGDRRQDVLGAKACGLDCLAVYYGYAEEGELEEAGAEYIVNTVEELRRALLDK